MTFSNVCLEDCHANVSNAKAFENTPFQANSETDQGQEIWSFS